MKYIISIALVFSFLFQNVSKLIIVINFRINQEYIAKNLCVNRDKPDSCCEGKCELKKQLDEEDKKENLPANTFKDKFEKQNYYSPAFNILAANNSEATPDFKYLSPKTNSHLQQVFHPPPFSS
jgi:hypothetical protein